MSQAMKKVKDLLGSEAVIVAVDEGQDSVRILANPPADFSAKQKANMGLSPKPRSAKEPQPNADNIPEQESMTWVENRPLTREDMPPPPKQQSNNTAADDIQFTEPMRAIRFVCDLCETHQTGYDFCERWLKNLSKDFALGQFGLISSLTSTLKLDQSWIFEVDYDHPIILVGPQGGGKTAAAAKLSTMLISADRDVAVGTLDTIKMGGVEQLEAYMNMLNLPLYIGDTKVRGLVALRSSVYVIDTPGVNIFSESDRQVLARLRQVVKTPFTLVLPADMNPSEIDTLVRAYKEFDTDHIIITRLDATRYFGGFLNAASRYNMLLSMYSESPSIVDGLRIFTAGEILKRLQRPVLDAQSRK